MLGRLRSGALMAAVVLGLGSMAPALSSPPPTVMRAPAQRLKGMRIPAGSSNASYSFGNYGRKGAGITMARQQRTAAKKRSVARNRRHHR